LADKLFDENVIHPAEFFKLLNIPRTKEAEKVFFSFLSYLIYMPAGKKLVSHYGVFEKLDDQYIHIDTVPDVDNVWHDLKKSNVIK
tara:strand:+ start:1105 stop:1362 length:258 start_codon:yes stop_codon:yes gene_type:complete